MTAGGDPGRVATSSAWLSPAVLPFAVAGAVGVIGGGLLSAALAPNASYHGSWAVAYIVLVIGVAQIMLGAGQAYVTDGAVSQPTVLAELTGWNLASVATVLGTVLDVTAVLYVGAVLQLAILTTFLYCVRNGRRGAVLIIMRALIAIMLVSVPIGLVLQATGSH